MPTCELQGLESDRHHDIGRDGAILPHQVVRHHLVVVDPAESRRVQELVIDLDPASGPVKTALSESLVELYDRRDPPPWRIEHQDPAHRHVVRRRRSAGDGHVGSTLSRRRETGRDEGEHADESQEQGHGHRSTADTCAMR